MPQAGGAPCCPLVLLQGLRLCSYIPNLLQLPECAFCLPSQWLRVLSARLLSSPTFLSLTPGCDMVRWDPAPVGEQPQPAMAVQPRNIPKTPGLCAAGPEHSAGLQHYGTEAEQSRNISPSAGAGIWQGLTHWFARSLALPSACLSP